MESIFTLSDIADRVSDGTQEVSNPRRAVAGLRLGRIQLYLIHVHNKSLESN